ncbi:flagellar export protein FliJ [Zymobacter palmae]|uniref:Flagellar FliJ protein n=1 Tax=Zymobacter palmae TaxID=33074 RepID=A0A348HFE3_9GAMM|nr:flagellar export protein FliJ [Zymobacter palmae]BBG30345.1 flagellar biosynthesis chaperone [Zymobacter palmae]
MAKATSSLDVLIDLAEERLDIASRTLGHCRAEQQRCETQLQQIERYLTQYRQGLNQLGMAGAPAKRFAQQQAFIESLDATRKQQLIQLDAACQRVERALTHWQEVKRETNAYDVLRKRREQAALAREKRLDQRMMDEYASRARSVMSGT